MSNSKRRKMQRREVKPPAEDMNTPALGTVNKAEFRIKQEHVDTKPVSIADLPDQALDLIFSWLSQKDLYGSVALVCRRWRDCAQAAYPCGELTFRGTNSKLSTKRACTIVGSAHRLYSLTLHRRLDAGQILATVPTGSLRRLDCSYSVIQKQDLSDLFARCKNLSHLTLNGCSPIINVALKGLGTQLPNLQTLSLNLVGDGKSVYVYEILRGRQPLKEIRLSSIDWRDRPLCGVDDIKYIADQFSHTLELLQVDAHAPSVTSLRALADCRRLRTLRFMAASCFPDAMLCELAALPGLEALEFDWTLKISSKSFSQFLRRAPWAVNLRCLVIKNCYCLSEHLATSIAVCCPNLEYFDLSNMSVCGRGLEILSRGCPNLHMGPVRPESTSYLW